VSCVPPVPSTCNQVEVWARHTAPASVTGEADCGNGALTTGPVLSNNYTTAVGEVAPPLRCRATVNVPGSWRVTCKFWTYVGAPPA
jgi:hypothetical protein